MDRLLYIAMSGAKEIMRAQTVNSNNLANASTTGFRADFEAMVHRQVYGPGYENTRLYTQTNGYGTDFSRGNLVGTGRPLDVAVDGDGWIAIQAPDGTEAYTRDGNLRKDASGLLMTETGYPVMGNEGPITVPEDHNIEIGQDGTITIRPLGSGPESLTIVDRIKLVNPDVSQLEKGEDGLIRLAGGEADPDANVRLFSGTLESSNVNTVEALVDMIGFSRQFELQVKMMKSAEDQDAAVTQLMRLG
jgi:flagellar basal-body rod protein FlgF